MPVLLTSPAEKGKGKGKVHPRTGHEGPKGEGVGQGIALLFLYHRR
jgi:hypothetical protein